MHSEPVSQEVEFGGVAQVLMAVFAISPWTPWLVRRVPMQIESHLVSKVGSALKKLTFLSRATERSMCVVTHHIEGSQNRGSLLVTREMA
jgi:hypothetical protein